jgi:hypothetical protein
MRAMYKKGDKCDSLRNFDKKFAWILNNEKIGAGTVERRGNEATGTSTKILITGYTNSTQHTGIRYQ